MSLSLVRRTALHSCATAALLAFCAPIAAQAQEQTYSFDIPAQALAPALNAFGRQSRQQVVFDGGTFGDRKSSPVVGSYTADQAINTLLAGTGFSARLGSKGEFVVARAPGSGDANSVPEHTGQVDAVIVTAQRREENIQTVPVAVGVISGDRVENARIFDPSALSALAPSITLPVTNTQYGEGLAVRGVGTSVFSSGVESSVAMIVDGVLIGRSESAVSTQFADIADIQILRGPQGTLFGKNASSGAIVIDTLDPKRSFAADASVLGGQQGEYRATVNVTGPLGDNAAASLSAYGRGYGGYTYDPYNGREFNGLNSAGVRAKLNFDIAPDVTLKLSADFSHEDTTCCAQPFVAIDPRLLPYTYGAQIGSHSDQAPIGDPNDLKTTSGGGSAQINWAMPGGYELISISAYRGSSHWENQDLDRLAGPPATVGSLYRMQTNIEWSADRQVTQELRLQSPVGHPIDFVTGLYLFQNHEDHHYTRGFIDFAPGVPGCPSGPAVCTRDAHYDAGIDFLNYAAFGQANWHMNDAVTAFFGARYTHDDVSYNYVRTDFEPAPIRGGDLTTSNKTSADNFSVRTGIQYKPTSWVFLYGLYAQGYKGPGFFIGSTLNPLVDKALKPETDDSYELGSKFTFFDGRLLANITAYDTEYTNFVVNLYDPVLQENRTTNAAKVTTRGAEFELTAKPINGLSLTANASYIDAFYSNFQNASCAAGQTAEQGCVVNANGVALQNLTGEGLDLSSPWRFSLAGDYVFGIGSTGFNGLISSNYVWNSSVPYGAGLERLNNPILIKPAYGILNLSLGILPKNGAWKFRVWANNLTDQFYNNGINYDGTAWTVQYIPYDYHRRVGAEFSVKFH